MNLTRKALQSFVFNPVNAAVLDVCASEVGEADKVLFTDINYFALGLISRLQNSEIWIISKDPRVKDFIHELGFKGGIFISSKIPHKLFNTIISFGPVLHQLEENGKLILVGKKFLQFPAAELRINRRYSLGSLRSCCYLALSRLLGALGRPDLKHYFEDRGYQSLISWMPAMPLGRLSVVVYARA